jgi:hypothetical protein
MAYDEGRQRTVVVGGQASADALSTDTWERDGTRWTRIAASVPGGRAHFALAYDTVRKEVVMFGGIDLKYRVHNDTSGWPDLAQAGRRRPSGAFAPSNGVRPGLGDDRPLRRPRGREPVQAAGRHLDWNGSSWTQSDSTGPPPRSLGLMASDAGQGRVVLFRGGSFDGKRATRFKDMWAWDGRWIEVK